MKVNISSIIKNKFIEILAFVLFIGLISNIFQLIMLENEIDKDIKNQVNLIAENINGSIKDIKLVSESIEHQIDLRLIGYSKNIADLLGEKNLDQITNEELESIRQHLGISGITLFARRGDDIVAIKSTDPNEIGFGFKKYDNGGYELIDTVLRGNPKEVLPVSYIDDRAIVTPVTISGSQPDSYQFFKYAHYHTPGTSYNISSFIEADEVFQFTHRLGPEQIIQKMKEENPYIAEIGVLMPMVFENPNLEEIIYPSYKRVVYGTFNETNSDEIEMLKNFDWANPYHHYSNSKDGKKLYKAFLPLDREQVVFIALDYEEFKSPLNQRLLVIIILAILSFLIFILLVKKISRKTKETEHELWKSKHILSSIIEHSPLGVIAFDQDQRIMIWNKSAEMIYGRTASEVEGQFFTTSHQQGIDEQFMKLMRSTQKEKPCNIEFSSIRTDGSPVSVSCSMAPLLDSKNHRIGYVTIHRDITVHKQMEEKLLYTEKLSVVSQLSAAIAHEIRNPLTSIKGFVQLMKETSQENHFYLDIMETELNRINDIVGEFMSLAKPQAQQFRVLDIREILQQTLPLFESIANLNNIRMTTEISNETLAVHCIEHQMKQVFINIMKNSIEAMPSNGHLHITAKPIEDGKISIRFIDNGPGIPEERLQKLGEPFYTTKEKGSGLGLMICYKIIHTHEGDIHISSTVGVGTTVEIVLPMEGNHQQL